MSHPDSTPAVERAVRHVVADIIRDSSRGRMVDVVTIAGDERVQVASTRETDAGLRSEVGKTLTHVEWATEWSHNRYQITDAFEPPVGTSRTQDAPTAPPSQSE